MGWSRAINYKGHLELAYEVEAAISRNRPSGTRSRPGTACRRARSRPFPLALAPTRKPILFDLRLCMQAFATVFHHACDSGLLLIFPFFIEESNHTTLE